MGFDSIATTSILFIAILITATGVIGVAKMNIDETLSSATIKQNHYSNQLKTQITIEHAYYEDGNAIVYIKNVGNSQLKPELFTIFVDNSYFKLDGTNSIIVPQTDTQNTGVLDKNEVLMVNVTIPLEVQREYIVRAFTQYETGAIKTFTT